MSDTDWALPYFEKAKARKTAVVARLQTERGGEYFGVNVESSCPTLSVCAERVAIFTAVVAEGPSMKIRSLQVIARKQGKQFDIIPCGGCRQLVSEFACGSTFLCGRFIREWLPEPYL
jgi:cytidine deaminase